MAAVASVGDRVLRRVAALGPHVPRLAAAMSVLGSNHRLRDAAAVAGGSEANAATTARQMCRVELSGPLIGMFNFSSHTPLAPKLFLDPDTGEPVNPRSG